MPKAGRQSKLIDRGRRALVREVDHEPDWSPLSQSSSIQSDGDRRTFEKDTHLLYSKVSPVDSACMVAKTKP